MFQSGRALQCQATLVCEETVLVTSQCNWLQLTVVNGSQCFALCVYMTMLSHLRLCVQDIVRTHGKCCSMVVVSQREQMFMNTHASVLKAFLM